MAQLEAELLRRTGGEWVIVHLAARDPEALPPEPAPTPTSGDEAGVRAALAEYESALEGRDRSRLARVWVMNPAEKEQMSRFFRESASIQVSIADPQISVDGDHASLRFDQEVIVSKRSWLRRALRPSSWRDLFASDETGTWTLDEVVGE